MSSKKKRKALKAKHNKRVIHGYERKIYYKLNKKTVLLALKQHKNEWITGPTLENITNINSSDINKTISGLIYYDNEPILTKQGRGGGYMYYG